MGFVDSIGSRISKLRLKGPEKKENAKKREPQSKQDSTLSFPTDSAQVNYTFKADGPQAELSLSPQAPQEKSDKGGQIESDLATSNISATYTGAQVKEGPNGTLTLQLDPESGPTNYLESSSWNLDTGVTYDYIRGSAAKEKSHAAALATELNTCLGQAGGAASGAWMSLLGGLGGTLLLANGLARAISGTGVERIEGLADSNWGAQTLAVGAAGTSKFAELAVSAGKGLGLVGGSLQTGLGIRKAAQGIKSKDLEKTVLGGLESIAGGSWILASLGVAPVITLSAFLALSFGTKAYEHRGLIKALGESGLEKLGFKKTEPQSEQQKAQSQ